MDWQGPVLTWVPLAALIAIGTIAAVRPSPRALPRLLCGLAILACGGLALAGEIVQHRAHSLVAATRHDEIAVLAEGLHRVWRRFDEVAQLLPVAGTPADDPSFDTVVAATAALEAKADEVAARVKAFREEARYRTINDDSADRMAAYLRPFGRHRVVVSCAPDDVEAYFYANRIATVLRAAGWEALGPETTTMLGAEPTLDVALYVRGGGAAPEAAAMLLEAFSRFNIPYQSKLAASDAIPDA